MTTHPIQISVGRNEEEDCYDCCLMAGNFPTEEAAGEYAKIIAEFLAEEAGGDIGRIQ